LFRSNFIKATGRSKLAETKPTKARHKTDRNGCGTFRIKEMKRFARNHSAECGNNAGDRRETPWK